MAAYDNVSLAAPPNIATTGNYAQQLYQMLSSLPKQYYEGQDAQYRVRNQNLFKDGVPQNAAGQPDYVKMMQQMVQAGGAPTAAQVLPMLQRQPFVDAAVQQIQRDAQDSGRPWWQGGGTAPPAGGPPPAAAGGPAAPTVAPSSLDAPAASGAASSETTRTLAASIGGEDRDIPGPVMDNIARSLGLPSSDADVPPGLQPAVRQRIQGYLARQPAGRAPPANGPGADNMPTAGGSTAISPPPTSDVGAAPATFADRFAAAGDYSAPEGGRTPMRVTVRKSPEAPAKAQDRVAQVSPPVDPAAGLVPRGFSGDSRDFAAALRQRAEAIRRQSNAYGTIGMPTKAKEDQAAAYDKQADEIDGAWKKAAESTPEQKNVASGATQRNAELTHEVESGQKEYDAITELGNSARQSSQKAALAQSFLDSDEFYSGPAEGLTRKFKQWAATLGGDPNYGTPQEAFKKAVSDLLSEQIRAMGKSGVGRVLLSEVQNMRDSIASLGVTPATNRLLLEEVKRVHKAQMEIQDGANAYVQAHGHLDAGFQSWVSNYYRDHPLFTAGELRDPRLIAPPIMPPGLQGDAAKRWFTSRGLKSGDPVKTQDNRIGWVP